MPHDPIPVRNQRRTKPGAARFNQSRYNPKAGTYTQARKAAAKRASGLAASPLPTWTPTPGARRSAKFPVNVKRAQFTSNRKRIAIKDVARKKELAARRRGRQTPTTNRRALR